MTSALVSRLHIARHVAAIVGYLLDQEFTDPKIEEMTETSDGFVLARHEGDIGMNDFMGSFSDLRDNWYRLIEMPEVGLTAEETEEAQPGLPCKNY